jgi:hypothetical protein
MIKRPKVRISELVMQRQNPMDTRDRGEQETLIEIVRSLKIEVQSYKEDNEILMREQSQINSRVMQSLN